jgi:ABC-type antimicrobial peptide transport system permease subunit
MRLQDAQAWLGVPGQTERLLVVWNSDTAAGSDAKITVSRARDTGNNIKAAVQERLGDDYTVELPKYAQLDSSAQGFVFQQVFITLYGLLSMGIVGLMVNALMMSTVTEQKHDLAVLRVIGAPRTRLFEAVIIEVMLLGIVGVVLGLLLGRLLNDQFIAPLLMANLDLPTGVRTEWTLESVLTPTLITALVLAVATISPARTAAATKVMVVLNPAAADQPTLEDLSKLRERRANYGLLVTGLVLLAFCGVILFIFPLLFSFGDQSAFATVIFATFLLMVVGMSLVFYFVTTPLERVIIWAFSIVSRRATFFTSRYALRSKGRNSLISLMVVASAVLPCLLATQLALQDANLDTDFKFMRGSPAEARYQSMGDMQFFGFGASSEKSLGVEELAELREQNGISDAVGVAEQYRDDVSDQVQLRSTQVGLIGVEGDLNQVLYPEFMQWAQGDASALTRITTDPDAVIISGGLSELLDLHLGDTLRVKGAGFDHERLMTIVGVGTRLPGFNGITRNRNNAQGGSTSVLMNIETYRELRHDPEAGYLDADEPLFSRAMLSLQPGVDEMALAESLRETFSQERGIDISFTREVVESIRGQLQMGRIFILALAAMSMVTAVFGVLAVMYTAVMNRRVEIAMLKALGASGGILRAIFVGEALVTTLAAALAGIVGGTLLGYGFDFSQRFAQETPMVPAFDSVTAIVIVVMVCLAAIVSALLATQPVLSQKAIRIMREK